MSTTHETSLSEEFDRSE